MSISRERLTEAFESLMSAWNRRDIEAFATGYADGFILHLGGEEFDKPAFIARMKGYMDAGAPFPLEDLVVDPESSRIAWRAEYGDRTVINIQRFDDAGRTVEQWE